MSGETWIIDDGELRMKAEKLVEKYEQRIGFVDLSKVMFCRLVGSKVSWAGKCWSVKPPWNLLTMASSIFGGKLDIEPFDIRYIIALNDTLIRGIFIAPEKEWAVILHELLHIRSDMEGCQPHDIEDFSWMLKEFGVDWSWSDSLALKSQLADLIESPPDGVS